MHFSSKGICQINLLQVITPNNLNRVSFTMKFKKILINFLLEKSFYSVEEFMTIDP